MRSLQRRARAWLSLGVFLTGIYAWQTKCITQCSAEVRWNLKSTAHGDLPVPNSGNEQTCCIVLDVDQDGIDDFVIGERTQAPSLVWYKWHGRGWYRYIIDPNALPLEAGGAVADIDGDGDLDLVVGEDYRGNRIWWWENPAPDFRRPWQRRIIKNYGDRQHHDQAFGDFLKLGRPQLVSWNQKAKSLLLFEIPKDPRQAERWDGRVIFQWVNGPQREGFSAQPVDVDLDGQIDIVGGGSWFKHKGGYEFEEHVIDTAMVTTRCAVGQLVAGGRPEIVFSPAEESGIARWYQWDGNRWIAHDLGFVRNGHTCEIADFDQDGHLDILIGEMGKPGAGDDAKIFIWYGDGEGSFRKTIAWHGLAIHEGRAGDFNGDGRPDILVKPYSHRAPRIDVLLNMGTQDLPLDRWTRVEVGQLPHRAVFVNAADINGDGLLDIVAGAWWWENPGAVGTPWRQHSIGLPLRNMATVYDFDGDTLPDVLGTKGEGSEANREFVWARNTGRGEFEILHNVHYSGGGDFLQGCIVGSFSNSLHVVLSWHRDGGGIHILSVPETPANSAWGSRLISETVSTPPQGEDLALGDIDSDGDLDLLLGDKWLRNDNGQWATVVLGHIEQGEPDRCRLADVNRDGRLDAVISLEKGTDVLWFEQPVDPMSVWHKHRIGVVDGQGFSMDVADFDGDGYPDVVVGEHRGFKVNRVIVFRNPGRLQPRNWSDWPAVVIDEGSSGTIDHHDGTLAYDIDRDGDLDIVSIGWHNPKVWLFVNKAIRKTSNAE